MIAAALALMLAAAPTVAAPPADNAQCINQDGSTRWTPVDAHTILVSYGPKRFRVTTSTCPGLARASPQINVVLPGGGYICSSRDAHVYVSTAGGIGPAPCFIRSIAPISDAQAKALASRR